MPTMTANQRTLRSAFLAGAIVTVGLLVATWFHYPTLDDLRITSTRTGVYVSSPGGLRTSNSASMGGVALYCSASIVGAGSACWFATISNQISGSQMTVDEARVKTLWGPEDVVIRMTHNGTVVSSKQPEAVRDHWRSLAIDRAFIYGFLMASAFYFFRRS